MVYKFDRVAEGTRGLQSTMSAFVSSKETSRRSMNVEFADVAKRQTPHCPSNNFVSKRRELPLRSSLSTFDEILLDDFSPVDLSSVDVSSIDITPSLSSIGIETVPTFEPVVNYPALVSFLFIAITFGLLQMRINMVQTASVRRKDALKGLRQAKASQLSSSNADMPEDYVQNALFAYKNALIEEENLRTIIPGVRIAAPNNPVNSEEDVKYAKQYLGLDLSASENNEISQNSQRRNESTMKRNNMSMDSNSMSLGSKLILGIVGMSQLFLLCLFSFDPMTSVDVFGEVAGSPISILASNTF